MTVHLYAVPRQPATRFRVAVGERTRLIRCSPRRRWAAYCEVEVYYDAVYAFCRPGRGCRG